jgi:hypothetical protein
MGRALWREDGSAFYNVQYTIYLHFTCYYLSVYTIYTRSLSVQTHDWIQLGRSTDRASERSERTRWKHRLWHLFYCCVTYHVNITQAAHSSAGRCPATRYKHSSQKTVSYCCQPPGCLVQLLFYDVTANHRKHVTWSLHTAVWRHLRMRCIALHHTVHAQTRRKRVQCTVARRMH